MGIWMGQSRGYPRVLVRAGTSGREDSTHSGPDWRARLLLYLLPLRKNTVELFFWAGGIKTHQLMKK